MSLFSDSIAADIREFTGPHSLKERTHDFVVMPARAKWFLFFSVLIVAGAVSGLVYAAQDPEVSIQAQMHHGSVRADSNLVFSFSRPMSRTVGIEISPEIPGNWYFEGRLTRLHLAQDFRFEPLQTWLPDTEYTVTFKDLHNVFGIGDVHQDREFTFRTQAAPEVVAFGPDQETEISPDTHFVLELDQPHTGLASYDVVFDPPTEVEMLLDETGTHITYVPAQPLQQGTRYAARVTEHHTRVFRDSGKVAFEGEGSLAYEGAWHVAQAPGVSAVSPTGNSIPVATTIRIDFDAEPREESVSRLDLSPDISGLWSKEGNTAVFTPTTTFAFDTTYTITVPENFSMTDGGYVEKDISYSFTTIGPVRIVSHSPASGATGIAADRQIRVDFDQAVDHASAESSFSITPQKDGTFAWDGATLIFSPSTNFSLDTGYTVSFASGIKSIVGQPSNREYAFTFTTQPTIVKLAVPLDFQDRPLSCEAAALKMALAYKGVSVSETDIMNHVGYDPTPHVGNTWGNPYNAFVGDIDGKQSTTGYGVYWEPIARAATVWRDADYFVHGTVQQLTEEISKGNPVVVWGNAGTGKRVDWYTPDGELIYAFNGEHARTVIGFIGAKDNPTHIIANDPIYGQITYTRSAFEANWGMLFKAGVIVR